MKHGRVVRSLSKGVVALLSAFMVVSFVPAAFADQQQSAENRRTAVPCRVELPTPSRPGPGTDPIEVTAQRSLGCHNANVELIIYENLAWWPDEQEAYAADYFAVGGITARGNGADKVHGSTHYAILKVNGQQVARSGETQ